MLMIRDQITGTYYTEATPIGPLFGGTWYEAKRFSNKVEAVKETLHHGWGLVEWSLEEEYDANARALRIEVAKLEESVRPPAKRARRR